eukprot:TRINITY_DN34088_c0_g1_i1.p1 TRINITY_DN34088_c0_g1~~TRINITY_DN34088_c0_g1_i1.p1  ORF type:complete len:329 (-),score=45.23 TRINITY_DN34088_c0_g1_i1:193-1179(-)
MPYVRAEGATIHFLALPEVYDGDRPVVVFVHGGGGNAYAFMKQVPFFAAEGYFVVSMSSRGWGNSKLDNDDAESYAMRHLGNDVVAVLDACGVQKAAVVGHSVGGFTCMQMAVDHPHRLTHIVMSSTFYGMVDEGNGPLAERWISRYINRGLGVTDDKLGIGRDDIAAAVKQILPPGCEGAKKQSFSEREGRTRCPTRPDNFSPCFRARCPDVCWLFDALDDGNEQVKRLNLKSRFKILHATSAVSPTRLRESYKGPLLFTCSECDSSVHWELVYLVAGQCSALDTGDDQRTVFHCWRAPLMHAPYIEDSDLYNCGLLSFFRGEPMIA